MTTRTFNIDPFDVSDEFVSALKDEVRQHGELPDGLGNSDLEVQTIVLDVTNETTQNHCKVAYHEHDID